MSNCGAEEHSGGKEPIFHPIDAEDASQMPTCIDSLCVSCEEQVRFGCKFFFPILHIFGFQGVTKLLLTKIPFYKDVILMSFQCDHCGYRNCEIQSGGQCQEHGLKLLLKVENDKVSKSLQEIIKFDSFQFNLGSKSSDCQIGICWCFYSGNQLRDPMWIAKRR